MLVGLVLCRGLVDLCVLPPFEAWDEYQHVGYVEHIRETGEAAVLGESNVPAVLLAEAVAFPHPTVAVKTQIGGVGAVDHSAFWAQHNPLEPGTSPPTYRGGSHGLYQAQHAPLYYRLAAPLYAALGGAKALRASVGGLRLANLGLTAAAVWIVLGALRRILRRERDASLVGLTLAAHPLFLFNGARVANDALGVFLASVAVAACLTLDGNGRRFLLHGLGIGLLIGLAVSAKATNLGLVPFAAFAWLAAAVRGKVPARQAALGGLLMGTGFLAVVQSELRFNLAHYGHFTAMQEAVLNARKGVTPGDHLVVASSFDWPKTFGRLWSRDLFFTAGWSYLRSHPTAVRLYRDAVTAGLLGWAWWATAAVVRRLRGRQKPLPVFVTAWMPLACLVLVASDTAALGFHMVQSTVAWGAPTTNPWYACPVLPWFLALVVAGGVSWPLGRWFRPAIPAAMAGAGLTAELVGVWGRMIPAYTGDAAGFEALRRLAWLQPGCLGTATLTAAVIGEVVVIAMLVLVWHDALRAEGERPELSLLLRETHRNRAMRSVEPWGTPTS